MKLSCTAADLKSAAEWTAKIAPSNPRIPITSGVLIEAGESLRLSVTDLETFGSATVPTAVVHVEGVALVSARLLAAIAKVIPARSEVTLTYEGAQLEVKAERARWVLPAMVAEDWPTFPDPGEPLGEIDGDELNRALDRVLPVLSKDDGLPVLWNVAVNFGDSLTLAGTDRYRVARQIARWRPLGASVGDCVVPGQMLRHAGSEGLVTIRQSDTVISLQQANRIVMGRLIDAAFVKYGAILTGPIANAATEVTVSVPALRDAVDSAAVMLNEHAHLVLTFAADGVVIHPKGDGLPGNADTVSDVLSIEGDPITIGVNGAYLRAALACLDCAEARLTFTANASGPFALRPMVDGAPDDGYIHTLMALRLRERSAAA